MPARSRPPVSPATPPSNEPGFASRSTYSIPSATAATSRPTAAAQIHPPAWPEPSENRATPSTMQRTTSVARSTILPPPFIKFAYDITGAPIRYTEEGKHVGARRAVPLQTNLWLDGEVDAPAVAQDQHQRRFLGPQTARRLLKVAQVHG